MLLENGLNFHFMSAWDRRKYIKRREKWHTAALRKRMAEFELLYSKFRLFDTLEGF